MELDKIAREALAEYQKIKYKHNDLDVRLVEVFEILFTTMDLNSYWEFHNKVDLYGLREDVNFIISKLGNPKFIRQIDRFNKLGRTYNYLEDCFSQPDAIDKL